MSVKKKIMIPLNVIIVKQQSQIDSDIELLLGWAVEMHVRKYLAIYIH